MGERTVKIRVCVGVAPDGTWAAAGSLSGDDDLARNEALDILNCEEGFRVYWLAADLPIPVPPSDMLVKPEVTADV